MNRHKITTPRTRSPPENPDPELPISRDAFWRVGAQVSTVGIFVLALTGFVYLARSLLLPIVSAIVIGTMLGPLSRRAASYHVPAWLFATIVLVLILALLQGVTLLVSGPIVEWIGKAPEYIAEIDAKTRALESTLPLLSIVRDAISRGTAGVVSGLSVTSIVEPVVGFVTPAVGELLIFFATLFFFLIGRHDLRRDLVLLFDEQDTRLRVLRILNDIETSLTRYIGTVTLINMALGVMAGFGAYLLGLPNAVLFGVLAYFSNYLPYIGPAFVIVILFITGIISFSGLGTALVPPALYLALTTLEGHFITPNIVGQRFTLNPLTVFLSLAFWTWLWGPIGAFLSVPLLMIGLVILNHIVVKQNGELPE